MADLTSNLGTEKLAETTSKIVEAVTLPLAESVGSTINSLFFLVFGGIGHAAEKRREKYKYSMIAFQNECSAKINNVPAERLAEPSTQIIMQTLENAKACVEEEELREFFANLVAAACDSSKKSNVRPSFSDVISQLTPMNAKILKIISGKPNTGRIPMISCRDCFEDTGIYLFRGYIRICNTSNQQTLENEIEYVEETLSNLERLGILKCYDSIPENIISNVRHDCEWLVENAKSLPAYLEVCQVQGGADIFQIVKESFSFTPFGVNFLEACVRDNKPI
ncbi:MAG: DUF4393 domain-containing protein [Lachnospiraceae bacterium]|nr:DUF4393 domain-containing protein [Lachnospiraceae bacterium]